MRNYDIAREMLRGAFGISYLSKFKVYESNVPSTQKTKKAEAQNMVTVYMCARILSYSLSRMPLNILDSGKIDKQHPLFYQLRHRMSPTQNNQVFWSTLEYHRNIFGNGFVDIRKGKDEIVPPEIVDDYDYKGTGNTLRYHLDWDNASEYNKQRNTARKSEWVDSKHILHFKGISVDGVMGLPPISAAWQNMQIMDKATNTIISFYDNKAMSPMTIETDIKSAAAGKLYLGEIDDFKTKYGGVARAGETMFLPPNTKATPRSIHFADAELVATMKFTKDEICAMYGIPKFMTADSNAVQMDIEQQSMSFKTFTLAPISNIYEQELQYKLLSKEDLIADKTIKFDSDVMIDVDIKAKANAYAKYITSGLMSPNEAALKIGTAPIKEKYGDYKYLQAQMVPLQEYEQYNNLLKEDPNGKTIKEPKKE